MAQTHSLKIWPQMFNDVRMGKKKFEVRKKDRNFEIGDTLVLREFDPNEKQYTGKIFSVIVEYILEGGQFGIEKDFCVMGIKPFQPVKSTEDYEISAL